LALLPASTSQRKVSLLAPMWQVQGVPVERPSLAPRTACPDEGLLHGLQDSSRATRRTEQQVRFGEALQA
jgi:hypothetical protein